MVDKTSQGIYATLDGLMKLRSLSQGFSFLPKQAVHSLLTGQKASKLRGRGLDFEELRHYLPGDDVRNIDWKVTARMRGEAHVRVYTEERDRPCLLIVDQRINMFFGSKLNMKSVTAAETAAIAAWRAVDMKDRVGALIFNDQELREVRPSGSKKNVIQILKQIVTLNNSLSVNNSQTQSPEQLNRVLKKAASLTNHDYLVVLISDLHGSNSQTKRLLSQISQHNDVIIGFVHDSMERELPNLKNLAISDGELQLVLEADQKSLATKFTEFFDERVAAAHALLLSRKIPLLSLNTDKPTLAQIRSALGRDHNRAA